MVSNKILSNVLVMLGISSLDIEEFRKYLRLKWTGQREREEGQINRFSHFSAAKRGLKRFEIFSLFSCRNYVADIARRMSITGHIAVI